MEDLVAWLREQIAQTERDVRESPEWPQWNIAPSRMAARINDVLAQCEAHRLLVANLAASLECPCDAHGHHWAAEDALGYLALAYQHRPGYREEWKP